MQEISRYAVGLDVGTSTTRVVVGHLEDPTGKPTIIGVSNEPNTGLRKGVVVNLVNAAQSVDKALEAAERMSGHQINTASVSINGSHIVGMSSKGVIAVGATGHEINDEDIARVEDAATVVQLPVNREILEVTPRSYQLDGQENIKDPLGMTGVRLEVDAHVITALGPHLKNLEKTCEMTETVANNIILSGLAASTAVLSDQQKENGVVLLDIGASTTNIVVFEEGDLQHVAVLPIGGNNITNDLAIGLRTELDVAEKVKLEHAVAHSDLRRGKAGIVEVKMDKSTFEFNTDDIDMIVDARLEEIFELANKELKSIGRAAKLPGGVVICGGSANLKGIADYAREALKLSARVGKPQHMGGMADQVNSPEFATAVGLMMSDLATESKANMSGKGRGGEKSEGMIQKLTQRLSGVFGKIRS